MSGNKKTSNKQREENANKTYTVERLLKRRKRKGRIEYLVKWKHYDKSHNSWEPEGNILDKSLIESYKTQIKSSSRRLSSPKKSPGNQNDDLSPLQTELEKDTTDGNNDDEEEQMINPTPIDYWYPPICEEKTKIAITDITSDNITITFRELI